MSWSLTLIGKPENVASALQKHSESLDGQSKVEFDAALPHLVGLVNENFNKSTDPIVRLTASGHGYATSDGQQQRQCLVSLETLYGTIV